MARFVVFEEFRVTVLIDSRLRPTEYGAIRRTLDRSTFQAALRRGLRLVFGRYPALGKARIAIGR
jgi:hypothetical protein